MKRIMCFLALPLLLALLAASSAAADLTPLDREALTAFAASCPEDRYAARVGFAAVALNRLASEGFPDSIPEVVRELAEELRLGDAPPHGEKLRRISADAVRAAEAGADPTGGALFIRVVREDGERGFDWCFDDSREERMAKKREERLKGCAAVIGCVGFSETEENP